MKEMFIPKAIKKLLNLYSSNTLINRFQFQTFFKSQNYFGFKNTTVSIGDLIGS